MIDAKRTCFTCYYHGTQGQSGGCWVHMIDDRCPFHRTASQDRREKASEQMLHALHVAKSVIAIWQGTPRCATGAGIDAMQRVSAAIRAAEERWDG